jgi:hypothetical protein
MSSISKILESVSVRWDVPSYNEEKNEFKRYKLSSDDIDEIKDQFKQSNMTELSDYVWSNLRNTESWKTDNFKKVVEVAKKHNKDYRTLVRAMLDEKYIKAPIVLKHGNGNYELVAGNTRLMLCRAFSIRPKVLMVSLKKKINESILFESFKPSWLGKYYTVPELSEYFNRRATVDDILYYWKNFGYKLQDTSKFHTKLPLSKLDDIKEWDRETCPRNTEEENAELEDSIRVHGYKSENPMMVILDKYEGNPPKVGEGCHRIMVLKRLGYSPDTLIPVVFRFVDNTPEEIQDEPEYEELIEKKSKTSKLLNKKTPTVAQLANKYGASKDEVQKKLDKGIKIEMEHTKIKSVASEIARDHLGEDLFYYEKLKKIEERYNNLLKNFISKQKKQITEVNWKGLATGAAIGLASLGGGKSHAAPEKPQKPAIVQTQKEDSKKDMFEAAIAFLEEFKSGKMKTLNTDIAGRIDIEEAVKLTQAKFRGYNVQLNDRVVDFYKRSLTLVSEIKKTDSELYKELIDIGKSIQIRYSENSDGDFSVIVKSTRKL